MQQNSFSAKLNVPLAIAVQFTYTAVVVLCAAYVNMVFLSNYPPSMLSYFYFALSIIVALISLSLVPIIINTSMTMIASTQLALIVILVICKLLLNQHYSWVAFVFSLVLMQIGLLAGIIGPNAIANKFNILEFKTISKWLGIAGAISSAIIGLLLIYGLDIIGTQSIFYLLLISIMFMTAFICLLNPTSKAAEKKPTGIRPRNYILYRQLFIFSIIAAILLTLVDFLLKDKLGANFNEIQIGRFMAIYLAITSLLALIFQLGVATRVLERYGMRGLISTLPIFCIIIMIFVFAFPNLLTVTLAASGWTIFYYNFNNIGREIALNALPINVRNLGLFHIKAIAIPIGIGIAAIVLWFLNHYPSIRPHALIVLIFSVVLLLMSRRVNRDYKNTLGDVIQNKHFSVDFKIEDKQTIKIFKEISLDLLTHDEPEDVLFAIELLTQIKPDNIPPQLFKLINADNDTIRLAAIEYICKHGNSMGYELLMQQLPKEQVADIKWNIIQHLLKYATADELEQQLHLFKQDTPINLAARILISLRCSDLDTIANKLQLLNNMINHSNPDMRKWAAKSLANIRVGYPVEYLKCLLEDKNDQVAQTAIETIALLKIDSLLPVLIHKIINRKHHYSIAKAIVAFGDKAIPQLSAAITTAPLAAAKILIKILLAINPTSLVDILMNLTSNANITLITQFAANISIWSLKNTSTANLKPFATMKIYQEIELIAGYRQLLQQELTELAHIEVNSRLYLARYRLLHWIVVRSGIKDILNLIPKLFPTTQSPTLSENDYAKAIEYLTYSMVDKQLAKSVTEAFEKNITLAKAIEIDVIANDPWLKQVFTYSHSPKQEKPIMNIMERMLVLRKVDIFKTLSAEILLAIAKELIPKQVSQGEIIFKEKDNAEGFYIVNKGAIELSEQGVHLHEAKEHEVFGVLALLDNAPRVMQAVAKTDCLLLFLSKPTFDNLIDDSPELLRQVTVTIMFYLRQMIKVSQWAKVANVT